MRALVTGATGFVGSHLCEALVRQGASVTALVRSPAKAALLAPLGIQLVHGDLHTAPALTEAVRGQDAIFHVAGLTAARNEAEYLRANRDGTAALVDAARRSGGTPRLVLVSSMAAGGPSAPGRPLLGDEPPRPVTQYGRSKLAGEEVVRASGMAWVIVRPPMVYGPRDAEVLKVFRLVRTGVAPVFGDGAQELSAVYGPDLALALVAAATAEGTVGRIYYACHPERFRSEAFVLAVATAMQRRNPAVVHLPPWLGRVALGITGAAARLAGRATILTADKANEFFQPAWTGDPAPLTRDTGWSAEHDLRRGLAATAAWYRAAGWL
jgi:nucleoside-diphosphate-sugar epimerase